MTHLKAELRRLQNNKYMDSTICEMKGSHHIEEAKAEHCEGGSFDYSSGSGVVMVSCGSLGISFHSNNLSSKLFFLCG